MKLLLVNNPILDFTVSYLGYTPFQQVITPNKTFYVVALQEKSNDLNEVLIPKENVALQIIRKAIAAKSANNPQQKNNSFSFKSYNKLLVTANPDSINGKIDSVFVDKTYCRELVKVDSSNYKFKEIISKQHLFQTEKVSLFQYQNTHLKEVILGTKMAGFKQPIYEIIAFNLQSFSIYEPKYELFETKYNSPIADDAPEYYNYKLLDSVAIDGKTTYMIYFKNKKKKSVFNSIKKNGFQFYSHNTKFCFGNHQQFWYGIGFCPIYYLFLFERQNPIYQWRKNNITW